MVNDLKKFGLPNVKNIKIETLRPGYGETVCQLIDELVNLELYRRDFEFQNPIFPEDDDQGQSGDEEEGDFQQDEKFRGRNEIINGIEIETHAVMSPFGGNSSKVPRKKGHLAEETKMNFFDPQEEQLDEDQKIIETRIDPLEWKQEIDRVYRDLVNLEKDIEILVKQGGSGSIESFEECRRHIELIIEMCKDIKQSSHHQVRKVFASSGEKLDEDL